MSSIAKMATLLTAVAYQVDASYSQARHPLMDAPKHVNSIVREDGGISMRVQKESGPREMSHQEH